MNWNRIAFATILPCLAFFTAGFLWAKQTQINGDLLLELSSQLRPSRARIVIKFETPKLICDPVDSGSYAQGLNAQPARLAAMIGSQSMMTRLLDSLSHDERIKVLGDHYWDRGESEFGGLQVTPDEHFRDRIVITAKHRNPMVAELIATKLYDAFRAFQLEKAKSNQKYAVSYLEHRAEELRAARDLHQEAVDAARQSGDEAKIQNAELYLCVSKSDVREIEKRLAEALENPPLRTDPEIEVVSATIEYPVLAFRPPTDFSKEFRQPSKRPDGRGHGLNLDWPRRHAALDADS